MEFEKVIKERMAVRKFKSGPIQEEQLDKILEAGRLAPTAVNLQPQKIYVVQSEEGLNKIDKVHPCRYNAQTCLIICGDRNVAWHTDNGFSSFETDACIVATHMMLEATNIGVDSVWCGIHDRESFKKEFNLDDNIEPICMMPLGYRTDDYKGNPMHLVRKELKETVEYI